MRSLSRKLLALVTLIGILLLAGHLIRGVVLDRIANRSSAQESIAASLAESQTLAGPVLMVRYAEHFSRTVFDDKGKPVRKEALIERSEKLFLPEALKLSGTLHNETRYRGVFRINTYLLGGSLQSTLRMPSANELSHSHPDSRIEIEGAQLIMALSDPRGIRQFRISQDGEPLRIEAGTGLKTPATGVNAALPNFAARLGKTLNITADLQIAGTDSFAMLPLGRETTVGLRSDWPHPSFGGRFLPVNRKVGDKGFEAEWQINGVASRSRQAWETEAGRTLGAEPFSVSLIDPVDIYSMSDRASKYSELFILLTLGAFLLFETLRHLKLHPLNYLLVGAALLIFFLLLLSLSEQIGFGPAYLAAASACVLLIGFYSAQLLRSAWLAAGFTVGLGVLYGAIYVILLSEQNALLMGSLLLFALLACVMIGTRTVDWHKQLASNTQAASNSVSVAQ